jgi:endonuclease G, mitochondrial
MAAAAAASGYDPAFLGIPTPLPVPRQMVRELAYTHFTVLLDPVRRLAATTGVTIDGADLQDLDRVDDWHLDPRVPAEEQTGEQVYAGNDLDRGHLVRRRDPVWGPSAAARTANEQTFTYTNAAPQAAQFNQSRLLWAGLEDYVLEHARTYRQRLCVFTGPVLAADDPPYRGVQVPRRFYKIAAWGTSAADGPAELAATGYVLDQTPELPDLPAATARAERAGDPPPLGPYRTYQVPIADIATLTGLDLGPLVSADRLPSVVTVSADMLTSDTAAESGRWVQLHDPADIRL